MYQNWRPWGCPHQDFLNLPASLLKVYPAAVTKMNYCTLEHGSFLTGAQWSKALNEREENSNTIKSLTGFQKLFLHLVPMNS